MEILLIGAVIMVFALLASAWLMTFARWFPIKGIDGEFLTDYKTLIRAHIDFALMALFCLALCHESSITYYRLLAGCDRWNC
jgi:uncharacterized membrane protein